MISVRERPAAAESDEAWVALFGENHTLSFVLCPTVCR